MVKLFRRAGYEVAEVNDHQVALATLINEPQPIAAVVASFSGSGTSSCLKLLDAVRNHIDPRVNGHRMVLIIDNARQQMFSWQRVRTRSSFGRITPKARSWRPSGPSHGRRRSGAVPTPHDRRAGIESRRRRGPRRGDRLLRPPLRDGWRLPRRSQTAFGCRFCGHRARWSVLSAQRAALHAPTAQSKLRQYWLGVGPTWPLYFEPSTPLP